MDETTEKPIDEKPKAPELDIKKSIAILVVKARTEKKLSQGQLADMAGTSIASVQRVEKGKMMPNLQTLVKIANAFGVKVSTLLP